MKERGILFSASMVRALLAGTKTQTRRAWRDQPPPGVPVGYVPGQTVPPYGKPGDRMWVREAWRAPAEYNKVKPSDLPAPDDGVLGAPIIYEASRHEHTHFGKLRPGMFMPRWASRITLEIVNTRAELLTAISEEDARAEGMCAQDEPRVSAVSAFATLWDRINGEGSWDTNPWVWVVEFKRVEA